GAGAGASQTAAPASPGITPSLLSSFLSRSRHCSQYEVDLLISESTAATITPAAPARTSRRPSSRACQKLAEPSVNNREPGASFSPNPSATRPRSRSANPGASRGGWVASVASSSGGIFGGTPGLGFGPASRHSRTAATASGSSRASSTASPTTSRAGTPMTGSKKVSVNPTASNREARALMAAQAASAVRPSPQVRPADTTETDRGGGGARVMHWPPG